MSHTLLQKILCASAALGLSAVFTPPALAHDPRYPQFDEFFDSLYAPQVDGGGLVSCCDRKDCRALKFGRMGDPGVEAWYDPQRRSYAFVATHAAWRDVDNTGDDRVYYLTVEQTNSVRQKLKDGEFVLPETPTDDLAFGCWTRANQRAWCMVPPRAEF